MKRIKYIATLALALPLFSGCLEEAQPTGILTEKQVMNSESTLEALSNAAASYMTYAGYNNCSFGYPGLMMERDVMLQDMNVSSTTYDYFNSGFSTTSYLGNYTLQSDIWQLYYGIIKNANMMVALVDVQTANDQILAYLGNALVYRAMAYMDLTRLYEFKHTGYAELDAKAEKIMKLTVPLVTELTSEDEARNNPRVPFYQMYRFIMNDLNKAELYLQGYERSTTNQANLAVVYGMKARLYLEMATRFSDEYYPEDLATLLEHEDDPALSKYDKLNISSARECYILAASYARAARAEGHRPLTESEWHHKTEGFNKSNDAWIFAINIKENDNGVAEWKCFTSNMCTEQEYGVTLGIAIEEADAATFRVIDADLFSRISANDWRKKTWVNPNDQGDPTKASQYSTTLSADEWAILPAYTNLKFRPGNGNRTDYHTGTAVDIPLMRVEEMYFIEAEAVAHYTGCASGASLLKNFIQNYRYSTGTYSPQTATMEEFTQELILQKRIEFWGEGILAWDYKRLELPVTRGYSGTNCPSSYCYNSLEGYVAPWMNLFITSLEYNYNSALKNNNNPDPSGYAQQWSE